MTLLTLLQAVYSHNGLAPRFDGDYVGFFRKLISEERASGPILVTHTKNDSAVGVAIAKHEVAAAILRAMVAV